MGRAREFSKSETAFPPRGQKSTNHDGVLFLTIADQQEEKPRKGDGTLNSVAGGHQGPAGAPTPGGGEGRENRQRLGCKLSYSTPSTM